MMMRFHSRLKPRSGTTDCDFSDEAGVHHGAQTVIDSGAGRAGIDPIDSPVYLFDRWMLRMTGQIVKDRISLRCTEQTARSEEIRDFSPGLPQALRIRLNSD